MSGKKKDEAVWEDCACPLSMAVGSFTPDVSAITPLPHMCTISAAEFTKHYIFDRTAYEDLTRAPRGSRLARWAQQRCRENRMFVARPPPRPAPTPVPWRYDAPALDWALPLGWRAWAPTNPKFVSGEGNSVADYQMALDSFFLYVNVKDAVKQGQMREGVEAWTIACDEADVLVRGKHPPKSDRCFVTSNLELFAYLLSAGDMLTRYLKDFKIRGPIRFLRRLVDFRIDAKVKTGGCGHTFVPSSLRNVGQNPGSSTRTLPEIYQNSIRSLPGHLLEGSIKTLSAYQGSIRVPSGRYQGATRTRRLYQN